MAIFTRRSGSVASTCLIFCELITSVASITTKTDWQAFANQVPGRLHAASPFARPCFSTYNGQSVSVDLPQCTNIQQNYLDTTFRTDHYAGFFHLYGDGCISNTTNDCFLDPSDPQALSSTDGRCNQGLVSTWYLDVRSAKDVQAAYKFSQRTGTPISIKASGHDYMTRSSMQGSLALWVRNLKSMKYHESFQPSGRKAKPVRAITFGAGVNSNEAQAFANRNNVTLVGPSSPTVAIVGGWSLFGGHSVLSPKFGLGSDRLLEVEIVTPDGQHRICNAKQNVELFWALRGAGGGVFGVILSATVKVEPAMPVTFALLSFTPTAQNQAPFISLLINSTRALSSDGWGGPMSSSSVALLNPLLDETAASKSLSAMSNYVKAINGTVSIQRYATFYEFYNKFIANTPGDLGVGPLLAFRVLPKRLHDTDNGRQALQSFLTTQISKGRTPTLFLTPPAQFKYIQGSTSLHPAWRNSYWDVGFSTSYAWNATVEERRQLARDTQQLSADLTALAPEGAAYPNEADPWQKNWQREFWGPNYGRLAQLKAKYDPYGLLNCWRCVGFQDAWIHNNPTYECMGAFDGLV